MMRTRLEGGEMRVAGDGEYDPVEEGERQAAALAALEPPDPPPGRYRPRNPVAMVETEDGLRETVEALSSVEVVGLDVETDLRAQRLALIQIATAERTWLIDPLAVSSLGALARVFAASEITKVIHNASFERRVLGAVGFSLASVFDTLVVSRRLRGAKAPGGHRLDSVCQRELGLLLDKSEQCSDWRRRPLSAEQLAYAAVDAEVLILLHQKLTGRGSGSAGGEQEGASELFSASDRAAPGPRALPPGSGTPR